MNRLHTRMLDAFHALDDLGHSAALLGGLAVSSWVEPRFTIDADLAVSVDSDENAIRLISMNVDSAGLDLPKDDLSEEATHLRRGVLLRLQCLPLLGSAMHEQVLLQEVRFTRACVAPQERFCLLAQPAS